MTKIFNFALKSRGVVGRVAHAKSSDPATPPKFGTCTYLDWDFCQPKRLGGGMAISSHITMKHDRYILRVKSLLKLAKSFDYVIVISI